MVETELRCKNKNCNRFLGRAYGSVLIKELICARCKTRNKFDIRVKSEVQKKEANDEQKSDK